MSLRHFILESLEPRQLLASSALDTTFADNGKLIFGATGLTRIADLAVQNDGKILALVKTGSGTYGDNYELHRFNADGSGDLTYGGGDARVPIPYVASSGVFDLKLDGSGRAVVGGSSTTSYEIMRFTPDGLIDNTFNGNGRVDFGGFSALYNTHIGVKSDGKILVAHDVTKSQITSIEVTQFNSNGSVDMNYGTGGVGTISMNTFRGDVVNVAVTPSGKLLATGKDGLGALYVARFTAVGAPDSTFGDPMVAGGRQGISRKVFTDWYGTELAVRADDSFYVTATLQKADPFISVYQSRLARVTSTGQLDSTFGGLNHPGYATLPLDILATDLAIQSSGKILVTGPSQTLNDFVVTQYLPSGDLDSSFDSDGVATYDLLGNDENAWVAATPNGGVVIAGTAYDSVLDAIIRLSPDQTPGSIAGYLFNDVDGDGVQDFNEEYLAGRTAWIDADNDGELDPGERSSNITVDGFHFDDLAPGTYVIRTTVPQGWTQTRPSNGAGSTVTVAAGGSSTVIFGQRTPTGRISGFVFDDVDGDGVRDAGENALVSNRTVYIDADNDGILDAGEQSFTTQVDGFWFDGLTPNTYVIRQVVPAGLRQTAPANNAPFVVNLVDKGNPLLYFGLATSEEATTALTIGTNTATYVRDGSYASKNFGSDSTLVAKQSANAGNTRETYVSFDLSSVTGSLVSGKVRLYGKLSASGSVAFGIVDTQTGWSESSLTWNTRPGAGNTTLAQQSVNSTSGKWYEFDVTSYLQSQLAKGIKNVSFVVGGMGVSDQWVTFNSDEASSNKPELTVQMSSVALQGLVVSPSTITVNENGSNTFTVKLATQPSSNVTVSIARQSGDTDLTSNLSALTFTSSNWNTPQTVTISAANDADTTNGQAIFAITSTGLPTQTVTATENDDDTPATPTTIVSNTAAYVRGGTYANQNFGTATDLAVKRSPTGDTNTRDAYIKFDLGNTTAITSGKFQIYGKLGDTQAPSVALDVYSATDTSWSETGITWNNKPTALTKRGSFTVTGTSSKSYELDLTSFLQSELAAGPKVVTLVLKVPTANNTAVSFSSDEASSNKPQLVLQASTTVPQGIVLSTSSINVPETSKSAFTVKLATAPDANVTVSVARQSGDTDLTSSVSMLTFTPTNWNTPQQVYINAANDADTTNDQAIFAISSTGLTTQAVTATEIDDDAPATPVTITSNVAAYVRGGTYASKNFGTATDLAVKTSSASIDNTRESYITFDLSTLSTISSAKLQLTGKLGDTLVSSKAVNVYSTTDTGWTETAITWNNKPTSLTQRGQITVTGTSTKLYELDLTSFLQSELAAGHTLVTIVLKTAAAGDTAVSFNSDETSTGPTLVVN